MKEIILKNVRISYPFIFEKYVNPQGEIGKYQCSLLLDKKDTQTKRILDEAIEQCKKENNGVIKDRRVDEAHCFLKDGDNLDGEENQGVWVIKAKNNRRPKVVNRDRSPIVEGDDIIYGGCYVYANISLWFSNHPTGGRQILANLHGVQFAKDGVKFGDGVVECEFEDITNEFDDIPF